MIVGAGFGGGRYLASASLPLSEEDVTAPPLARAGYVRNRPRHGDAAGFVLLDLLLQFQSWALHRFQDVAREGRPRFHVLGDNSTLGSPEHDAPVSDLVGVYPHEDAKIRRLIVESSGARPPRDSRRTSCPVERTKSALPAGRAVRRGNGLVRVMAHRSANKTSINTTEAI